MFSESLSIADRNTIKLMVDELRDEKAELENIISEKEAVINVMANENAELANEISELKKRLAEAGL